jgi:hypothetical protein
MKVTVVAATALFAILGTDAFATEPKAFVCKFTQGASARYDEAEWSVKVLNEKLDLTFAGLNPQQGKAQLIGNAGASDLRFWKGAWTWNFVEVTDTGNVMTTTVFDTSNGKDFPAVHSRHTSVVGEPLSSQYRGICSARS